MTTGARDDVADRRGGHWDPLRVALAAQRERVGSPSYGEIAWRVSAARQDAGMSEHAARVARSTVYDLFALGKARINLDLVREVAAVLGVSQAQVDAWVALCHSPPRVADEEVPGRAPAVPAAPSVGQQAVLVLACIAINLVGRALVDVLHLPIYLDMVGTAIAAIALGPWRGAGVGVATNTIGVLTSGWVSLPFAAVNVVGAVMWGYGVHRFGWGRTLARFFVLCVAVAVACSLVAVPILVGVYGGSVGQGQDTLTQTFTDLGTGLAAAVGAANLMVSTADKLLSGFVALVVVSALPTRMLHLPASSIAVPR